MENQFIPYELAIALKELDFDEGCLAFYNDKTKTLKISGDPAYLASRVKASYIFGNEEYDVTLAPLYQQAFSWFRKTHDLYHHIATSNKGYVISVKGISIGSFEWEKYSTYEEAELEALKKLIKIIKERQ